MSLPRFASRALAALVPALLTAPAHGYALALVSVNGRLQPAQWPVAALPLRFSLNDRPLSLLPNLAANSAPGSAVEASMRAWDLPPVGITLSGLTGTADVGLDGTNLITFADTPKNRDVSANVWASTPTWWVRDGERVTIRESDIRFNPAMKFATDGSAAAADVQQILTHEMGHALGLDHSFVIAASMNPYSLPGQTNTRTPAEDDFAGVRALYRPGVAPGLGALSGRVLTSAGKPVFGAHVVATDASGITRVSAVSDLDGIFTITSLPAGNYQVYAEPIDGIFSPVNLSYPGYADNRRFILTGFRTAFLGDNSALAPASVADGGTTIVGPIRVEPTSPTLSPELFGWSSDGTSWRNASGIRPLQIEPGQKRFLVLIGDGLTGVPRDGWHVSGSDIQLDVNRFRRGLAGTGQPYVTVSLSANAEAPPGPRNLYLDGLSERASLTGFLEVVKP